MVTSINADNTGNGVLFTVEDLCARGTIGQWDRLSEREVTTKKRTYFLIYSSQNFFSAQNHKILKFYSDLFHRILKK